MARAHKAPGKAHRTGLSLDQLYAKFSTESVARAWFEQVRWPNGRACPRCGNMETTEAKNGGTMPYHCSPCRRYFSVKTGTVMQSSKLPIRTWIIVMYLMSTSLKGVASMKLHRDLGITQKTAWMMAQKIREGWKSGAKLSGAYLTRRDVRALLEPIAARAPVMANRTLACIRTMLNFAIDHDWIDANPAARVRKPAPEVSRDRVLDDDEIRRIWRMLSNVPTLSQTAPSQHAETSPDDDPVCPISAVYAALLKIRILTAQRGGEVARMRWGDVDLETGWWTIPGAVTKNGEPHRVPLVDDARTIIDALGSDRRDGAEYVFSGRGDASVLDRAKKAPAIVARALKIDFRGHDLRRTAATRMAAAGVPRDHIARVLNHVAGGARATRVYDRHHYDHEKRVALEAWVRALTAILTRRSTATVVPFGRQ